MSASLEYQAVHAGKRAVDDVDLESAYPGLLQSTRGIQFVGQILVLSCLINHMVMI
jgi:hypothetical protein